MNIRGYMKNIKPETISSLVVRLQLTLLRLDLTSELHGGGAPRVLKYCNRFYNYQKETTYER
jgi:hypothetical protein